VIVVIGALVTGNNFPLSGAFDFIGFSGLL
jgi:hypothetical protein